MVTETFTVTRIYETLVSESPWLVDETTLVLWTVTATNTLYPSPTPVVERAHARDFNL